MVTNDATFLDPRQLTAAAFIKKERSSNRESVWQKGNALPAEIPPMWFRSSMLLVRNVLSPPIS